MTDPRNPEMRKNEKPLAMAYAKMLPGCKVWLGERGIKFSKSFIKGGFMVGMGFMVPLRNYYEKKGGQILFLQVYEH